MSAHALAGQAIPPAAAGSPTAAAPGRRFGAWRWFVFLWTLLALAFVLFLFGLGALVTSYGVGMAVPDGHTTFGQTLWLYPWWEASFGIQLEHTHRLAGMAVGLTVLPLAVLLFFVEKRAAVRQLAQLAMMLVAVQGFLGIYRVEYNALALKWLGNQPAGRLLAALHGSFAQLAFAALAALALAASPGLAGAGAIPCRRAGLLRAWAVALPFLTFLQIVAGAAFRHTGQGFWFHAPLAYVLAAGTFGFIGMTLADAELRRRFAWIGWWLALTAFAQLILGNAAALLTGLLPTSERTITDVQAWTTAGHHLVGSLFFAGTIALAARALRTLRPEAR